MHPSDEDSTDPSDVVPVPRKLDPGLRDAYRAWQDSGGEPDAAIAVGLTFTGAISAIEAIGFQTGESFDEFAVGVIRFADIPTLVAHDGVLRLSAGRPPRLHLDRSAPDIRARASGMAGPTPTGGVWFPDGAAGRVPSLPDGTGRGVIVAIIDTGIDYGHAMFYRQTSPTTKDSRILRIWDQGARPSSISNCPAAALTSSGLRYGVEHNHTAINTALNGGAKLGHRDCSGHGTHVAGIAAGGVPGRGDVTYVGIAPEADIIVVKHMDVSTPIYARTTGGRRGAVVSEDVRFYDAVQYCLRVAHDEHKPVVINVSFGFDKEAGDSLDDRARFLDNLLSPTSPAPPRGYPEGAILVKAGGNTGEGLLGRIEVPASGWIEVPFRLVDDRRGEQNYWRECATTPYAPPLALGFWYRSAAAGSPVSFQVRPPHGTYTGWVDQGQSRTRAVRRNLSTLLDEWVSVPARNLYKIEIWNYFAPLVRHPDGFDVYRDYGEIIVTPKQTGRARYLTGTFHVKIRAPAGTVLYFHGDYAEWNGRVKVTFLLSPSMSNGTPRPAGTTPLGDATIADGGGRHVLTVAGYSVNGYTLSSPSPVTVAAHGVVHNSSRGPLRDYSDPPRGPLAPKPDIAAPGENIRSAWTRFGNTPLIPITWLAGRATRPMHGTSTAAPMVAGAVALLLDKHQTWNINEVRAALRHGPHPAVDPAVPAARLANAFGAGMIDALDAHGV